MVIFLCCGNLVEEKAKKAKERKNRKEELERERNPSWVPFPIGTKIRVNELYWPRKTVGIFTGYKGSVLAKLQLQKRRNRICHRCYFRRGRRGYTY